MNSLTPPKPRPAYSRQNSRRPGRQRQKLSNHSIYLNAVKNTIFKLNPRSAIRNPVMLVVWVGTLVTLAAAIKPNIFGSFPGKNLQLFNSLVTGILFLTLLLANFAEAIAEARGKAQADVLRATKSEIIAKKLAADGTISEVTSSTLQRGDNVYVVAGDMIPADGEVTMGVASVDESAITGESVPVLKESGSDVASSVTGGTRIISDELIIHVTADPGKGFIDRMITLLDGGKRQKTPNESALTVLLTALSLVFLVVIATLPAFASYVNSPISVSILVALLVALIPTTIGSLANAIGVAGMDRVTQFNVVATSSKAVEACGDVDTLILDKTGTITLGNRLAEEFIPIHGHTIQEIATVALIASMFDDTPEGKSIIRLAEKLGAVIEFDPSYSQGVAFSASTRMSGTNLADGKQVRKGAVAAIKSFVRSRNGRDSAELDAAYQRVSEQGGTPLGVALDGEVYGVIYLKDIVKPGIRDRLTQLRQMGVNTLMLTGDNSITASVIAKEVGVDAFIAEATPNEKAEIVQREQAKGRIVAMKGDGNNDAPALALANVGVAMNTGTQAAKDAANMVDLDSDPTKLIDIIGIGKQLLITRGALTIFSLTNDIAKYFAILPVLFTSAKLQSLNIMQLTSIKSAVLSALIYNALIIPTLLPLTLNGIKFKPLTANQLLQRNIFVFGLGGIVAPFVAIKILDLIVTFIGLA